MLKKVRSCDSEMKGHQEKSKFHPGFKGGKNATTKDTPGTTSRSAARSKKVQKRQRHGGKQDSRQNKRPTIICIESISFSANGNGVKDDRINSLLSEKGYMYYADTNINSIFVLEKLWKK